MNREDAEFHKWKGVVERDSKLDMDALRIAGMPKRLIKVMLSEFPRLQDNKTYFEDDSGLTPVHIDIDGEAVKIGDTEKVELKGCFDKIMEILDYYMDIPRDKKVTMTLWIIGTYYHEQFETYPYLFINSMRGSGKTRALKLITQMAKDGEMLMSMTEAGLFRTKGTLGIDEFESMGSKEKQPLRELLNASYKKGTKIVRMKKKKGLTGEEIVPEYFEPYRPIVMANIWGIEEVLSDRSITIILEKSNNPTYTKLIEDFAQNTAFLCVKRDLVQVVHVGSDKKHRPTLTKWNAFIKNNATLYTLPTLLTLPTLPTPLPTLKPTPIIEEEEMFDIIYRTEIDGRNLELYFPLFIIAKEISEEIFFEIIQIAKSNIKSKKMDDLVESKDITVYNLVAGLEPIRYYTVKELTDTMVFMVGDNMENRLWLNSMWLSSALKRLNLIIDKRRLRHGVEVTLDIEKAKKKLEMFK